MSKRFVKALVAVLLWLTDRRTVAAGLMLAGAGSAVYGSFVLWGFGVSLLVAAGLAIALSILVGWE